MSFSIEGKTAIVTGSGNGVGLAIGRLFAAKGANVMFADMDEKALVAELGDHPEDGNIRFFAGDLRERLTIANLLSAIKFAKYYELTEKDVVAAVATDSMDLYGSRLEELRETEGPYREIDAAVDYNRYLLGESVDNMLELSYHDRKRIHNLKYYTWVEQQGRSYEEIQAQWYDDSYWTSIPDKTDEIDSLIEAFNARVGLL